MSVRFEGVECAPLRDVSLWFDDGMIAGLVGPDGAGKSRLLELAAGRARPERGIVEATGERLLVEAGARAREEIQAAVEAGPGVLLLDHALAVVDSAARVEYIQKIQRLPRRGAVVLVSSHDLELLERIADVVVALEEGRVVEQGDPGLVLANYRRRMAERGSKIRAEHGMEPRSRHGDGRAEVAAIEIRGERGEATTTVRSGEAITVTVVLRFLEAVEKPVAGILIRNRIGVSIYGTNTELERVEIGARGAGETAAVEFAFRCELCPQEYTLTVASHDPDGTAHDWAEEAVLFSVVDSRYTAGVANLRARVRVR